MVISGYLEEVIEMVKKVTIYREDKSSIVKEKMKTNKNSRVEAKVTKGVRAIGALVVDQRERSKLLQETPTKRLLLGRLWW